MPVVVVLFHPETQQMYWQHISKQTAVSTGVGCKVVVPKAHSFDDPERTLRLLSEILQPEPYVRRLNKLRVDRRWMERIADGGQVVVEFDDWVNKSLPRYQVTLSCFEESEVLPMTYMPGTGIEGMLGTFCGSVVASTNFRYSGGSSSVFNMALKAVLVSMCTSSIMKTLKRPCTGL
jgi:hypothetical protein